MASPGGNAKGGRLKASVRKVVWEPRADRDREGQLEFIARDNLEAAVKMEFEINRQVKIRAEFPTLGREGRVLGTRELVVNRTPFILAFRVRRQRIEIIRMLHGAQMWPRPWPQSTGNDKK